MKGLLAGLGLVLACAALARVENLSAAPATFLALYGAAFLCYAAGARWLSGARGGRATVLVLGIAVLARLVLLPAPPTLSTDAYRYVWDARVARAGLNPYAHPPDAPELRHLRDDEIYPRLNHPGWHTIYPPGAQALFRAVYAVAPDSILAMKVALGLAELAGLALLLGLLRAGGSPPSRVVLYAWNPLVLSEVWGAGHLDAVVVPAVVGAAWAALADRRTLAAGLLGLGTLVKLYPAALLPLVLGRRDLRPAGVFLAVVLAGYAGAAAQGARGLGSLPRYLEEEHFNPGLVRTVTDSPALALLALLLWVVWVAACRREAPLAERAVLLIGGALLLSPNLFPWYAVWLVPFLAAAPSLPWLAFTGTIAFAYTFFLQDPWAIPPWARAMEIAPLAAGATWWLYRRRARWSWRERST